jgi:hypothetical protein
MKPHFLQAEEWGFWRLPGSEGEEEGLWEVGKSDKICPSKQNYGLEK